DEAPFANAANDIQPNAAFTSGSYTLRFDESATTPIRRFGNDLAVSWRISGTQGGLDFVEALDFAVAKWNAQSSLLDFTRGAPATGDTLARDGESRVIAGDPHGEVPGSCCYGGSIIAAAFVEGPADATTPFNGEPFFRITSADVIINDGVSVANFGQGRFNTTMAHELGHTLGLRHSDEGLHGGPCLGAIECCSGSSCFAIMRAAVTTSLLALQSWDKNAIDCLYDAECRQTSSCVPPAIATQPQNRTITPGGTTSLSVSVSGTLPFTYQWYAGFAGDTSQPIGGNSATLSGVSPLVTSQYWVRVSGSCGAAVNSRTAIVTVCRPPSISVQPEETKQVKAGERVTLSVAASGDAALTYAWFEGESGDTSTPLAVTSADFTSAPLTHETKFWVRVTNGCGSVNSATTTVRIVPARRRAVR
ncbi:MAG TPA: hypothetical protein VJZ00_24735, partial [Thermoanaerobaculia bacterium]|nr:hypothetical protein [Thermoanaerobaculia bacterium]